MAWINFAWPRAVPFTNPTPNQSGGLLDFHIPFLNKIPILWTVFVFIVLVGALYYLFTGRRKEAPGCSPPAHARPGRPRPQPSRLPRVTPVHEVRRVRLADGKPIAVEYSLFPAALCPGMLGCRLDGSRYELLEVKYGLRPHRARESLEPVIAVVREAKAPEIAEGAPLMLVERTAYARTGQPLEFARDLFRGDRDPSRGLDLGPGQRRLTRGRHRGRLRSAVKAATQVHRRGLRSPD